MQTMPFVNWKFFSKIAFKLRIYNEINVNYVRHLFIISEKYKFFGKIVANSQVSRQLRDFCIIFSAAIINDTSGF